MKRQFLQMFTSAGIFFATLLFGAYSWSVSINVNVNVELEYDAINDEFILLKKTISGASSLEVKMPAEGTSSAKWTTGIQLDIENVEYHGTLVDIFPEEAKDTSNGGISIKRAYSHFSLNLHNNKSRQITINNAIVYSEAMDGWYFGNNSHGKSSCPEVGQVFSCDRCGKFFIYNTPDKNCQATTPGSSIRYNKTKTSIGREIKFIFDYDDKLKGFLKNNNFGEYIGSVDYNGDSLVAYHDKSNMIETYHFNFAIKTKGLHKVVWKDGNYVRMAVHTEQQETNQSEMSGEGYKQFSVEGLFPSGSKLIFKLQSTNRPCPSQPSSNFVLRNVTAYSSEQGKGYSAGDKCIPYSIHLIDLNSSTNVELKNNSESTPMSVSKDSLYRGQLHFEFLNYPFDGAVNTPVHFNDVLIMIVSLSL